MGDSVIHSSSIANVREETKASLLLAKLTALTKIREIELFELGLLKAVAELLEIEHISMYKLDRPDPKCSLMVYSAQYTMGDVEKHLSRFHLAKYTIDNVEKHLSKHQGAQLVEVDKPEVIKVAQLWIGVTGEPYVSNLDNGYLVVYPMVNNDQIEALLSFRLPNSLTDDEMSMITSLLDIAYNYRNLLSDNQKDKLTGLLNRQTFEESILKIQLLFRNSGDSGGQVWNGENRRKQEKEQFQRYCLAIIDIDNFKQINDRFGHVTGDEVLLLLSYFMKQNFRTKDLLFRFGGEEFVVILSTENKKDAYTALERFRELIAAHQFPQVGVVSVSIGATFINESDRLATAIVSDADKALYYAKEHGKNQTCFFDDLVECGKLAGNAE